MDDQLSPKAIKEAREAALAQVLTLIRQIEKTQGVTRAALEAIKAEMQGLASQQHLFPLVEFAPPPVGERIVRSYQLSEDPDGRFAMYMNSLNPGHKTVPHDHTTWAVVVAIEGEETNKLYRRLDDGSQADYAKIVYDRDVVVRPGSGIAMMPDDIHSIHIEGNVPTRHIHCYGLALAKLDGRKAYDMENGRMQPYNRSFLQALSKPVAVRC
jgi:predicted metal-dependent enzyme (double-stranded beta helix superfamily)